MARIVYGVMGDARGHVTRALIVAREMPHHEFLFIGGGKVHDLAQEGYSVEDVPIPSTLYRNNRVDIPATVGNALKVWSSTRSVVKRVAQIIDRFDPDLILTDYEYFTPLAAHTLGRVCVSLDHQHVVTHCLYEQPREQRLSRLMTSFSIKRIFSRADRFLIISFYGLPPVDPRTTEVFPPIIKRSVVEQVSTEGDHVLVYQTSPTFHRLPDLLEGMGEPFIIYGLGERSARKNLFFKGPSGDGFLKDLASSRYVITNGGHNVVSEALFLGKPVFSFPIANAYEQFLNAHFLAKQGYGEYWLAAEPSLKILREFESRLDDYKARIKRGVFFGNEQVVSRLEQLITGRGGS